MPISYWAREVSAGHSSQQFPTTAQRKEANSQEKTIQWKIRFVSFCSSHIFPLELQNFPTRKRIRLLSEEQKIKLGKQNPHWGSIASHFCYFYPHPSFCHINLWISRDISSSRWELPPYPLPCRNTQGISKIWASPVLFLAIQLSWKNSSSFSDTLHCASCHKMFIHCILWPI